MNRVRWIGMCLTVCALMALAGCNPFGPDVELVSITVRLQNIPAGVVFSSVSLTVTGEGMQTVEGSFTAGATEAIVELPPGNGRSFGVVGTVADTDPHTARVFEASGIADAAADGDVVELTFVVTQARVLVPDVRNDRLVLIDDITGSGWSELDATDLGLGAAFAPYDADIDATGAVYVASYVSFVTGGIVKLEDITDTTPEELVTGQGITALAIDRPRDLLYFIRDASDYWYLMVLDLADAAAEPVEVMEVEFQTYGVAVDADGLVYVPDSTNDQILQIDPTLPEGSRTVDAFAVSAPYQLWDVAVIGGYLYVQHNDPMVTRVDRSTGAVVTLGGDVPVDPENPQPGELFGPRRFLALVGEQILMTDEAELPAAYDRIVGFDDIDATGWQTYGSTGTGTGQFQLFSVVAS